MNPEQTNDSFFEDLTNLNEDNSVDSSDILSSMSLVSESNAVERDEKDEEFMDIIGNNVITKKIIKRGSSDKPKTRDFVKISSIGKLESGVIFEDLKDFEIQIGDLEVVQGLDIAISFMRLGEIAQITFEPRFGYGSLGLENYENPELSVPPDAKLTYVVEVLEIRQEKDELTLAERKQQGNRKRERANFWYNRNEFNIAIQIYRRALEYLDDIETGHDCGFETDNKELQELLEDRLTVYNNLAMAQIKASAFDAALISVEHVLRCQPNNYKALFRKGRILDAKGDTKGAIALLQKAATLEPESKSIQQDLSKLIIKNRREERNEKKMYRKMMGQANQTTDDSREPRTDRFTLFAFILGSILLGVAAVALYRYKY